MATGYAISDRVRQVLHMAREHAARLGQEYVSPDHLLLGLASEGQGNAAKVVSNLGVQFDDLAARLEPRLERGAARASDQDFPYTSRAKKCLDLAMREARDFGQSYFSTEHLLLAIACERRSNAGAVITEAGLDLPRLRAEIARLVASEPSHAAEGKSAMDLSDLHGRPVLALIANDPQAHGEPPAHGHSSPATFISGVGRWNGSELFIDRSSEEPPFRVPAEQVAGISALTPERRALISQEPDAPPVHAVEFSIVLIPPDGSWTMWARGQAKDS